MAEQPQSERAPAGTPVPVGRTATPEARFYLEWDRESVKQTAPLLNDVLQKLIVLSTALLGAFASLKELPVPDWGRGAAAVGFLAALAAALLGVYPRGRASVGYDPDEIKAFEDWTVRRKKRSLSLAAAFLLAGLAAGVAGIASRALS